MNDRSNFGTFRIWLNEQQYRFLMMLASSETTKILCKIYKNKSIKITNNFGYFLGETYEFYFEFTISWYQEIFLILARDFYHPIKIHTFLVG